MARSWSAFPSKFTCERKHNNTYKRSPASSPRRLPATRPPRPARAHASSVRGRPTVGYWLRLCRGSTRPWSTRCTDTAWLWAVGESTGMGGQSRPGQRGRASCWDPPLPRARHWPRTVTLRVTPRSSPRWALSTPPEPPPPPPAIRLPHPSGLLLHRPWPPTHRTLMRRNICLLHINHPQSRRRAHHRSCP